MKRILILMVTLVVAGILAIGCATNSKWNILPGIDPDHAAGICDQDRTDVCEMFGNLDALYLIISTYMVFDMDKAEALEMISDTRGLLSTNITSGELLMRLAGDSEKRKRLTYLAYKLGFEFQAGLDSTFMFDEESIATLNKYLDKLQYEVETYSFGLLGSGLATFC